MNRKQLIAAFLLSLLVIYCWRQQDLSFGNSEEVHLFKQTNALPKPNAAANKIPGPQQKAVNFEMKPEPSLPPTKGLRPLTKTSTEKSPSAIPFRNYRGLAVAYGDVLLGQLQEKVESGYAAIPTVDYWPSSTIAYHIQPTVVQPERILKALSYLSEKTSLQFIPFEEGMQDAIVFEPIDEHCLSYVGRISGTQPIFISPGCEWPHIVHEILHALGFIHEHSRPDRDQYIDIHWNMIPALYQSQFEILPEGLVKDWLHYPYDTNSLMHYGSQIFDKSQSGASLTRKDGARIEEPKELSPLDLQKIQDLFNGR